MKHGGTTNNLALIGGALGFLIVFGIVVYRSDELRKEAESQIKRFLATTENALNTYESFIKESKTITSFLKANKISDKKEKQKAARCAAKYTQAWAPIEKILEN